MEYPLRYLDRAIPESHLSTTLESLRGIIFLKAFASLLSFLDKLEKALCCWLVILETMVRLACLQLDKSLEGERSGPFSGYQQQGYG